MPVATVSTQFAATSVAPRSRGSVVLRHAAVGGVVGAALGAGLSLTALPFVGALTAPHAAAIGGAVGVVAGGLLGLLRTRGGVHGAHVGVMQLPPPPWTPSGPPPVPPVLVGR